MRLLLAALLLVHGAAMGQTFACQYTASGGLDWEKGRWEAVRFRNSPPFFLRIASGQMDKDVLEKVFNPEMPDNLRPSALGIPSSINCLKKRVPVETTRTDPLQWSFADQHICVELGTVVAFRPGSRMGTLVKLNGGLEGTNSYRDSIVVSPFTCQQM